MQHSKTVLTYSRSALIERLLSRYGSVSEIEERARTLLAQQRQKQGYVAGNLINLLVQLQVDLCGSDFSDLVVAEADLRQVNLAGVNFQNADLATSIFSETLGIAMSIDISPNGQIVAVGDSSCMVYLWNIATHQLLATFEGHTGWVWSVVFSPDGNTLASSGSDTSVRLWDVQTHQCLRVLRGHQDSVRAIAFDKGGQYLASGSSDHTIHLWDVQTGECLRVLQGYTSGIFTLAFIPNAQQLIGGSFDQTIRIWDVQTGECLRVLRWRSNRSSVESAFRRVPASVARAYELGNFGTL
jgi:tricorn protease-like protein